MLECEYLIGEGGSRGYCMTRGKVGGGGGFILYTFGVEGSGSCTEVFGGILASKRWGDSSFFLLKYFNN